MDKNTVFGVAGIWVNDATRVAFIPNADSVSVNDAVNLVPIDNSLGLTVGARTGTRPCEVSFTVRGLSPLVVSILGGYDLTRGDANADKQAYITGLHGDWSAVVATVTQNEAVPGIYHITKTAGGYSVQKLASLTEDLDVSAPDSTDTIPGVAITVDNALENGDYAVIDVYPATQDQGTMTPGKQARPTIGLHAASDPREEQAQAISLYIPSLKVAAIPMNLAANAEMSHEISGMALFNSQIGGYFRISQIVPE